MTLATTPHVRPLEAADEPRWRELFTAYREFYNLEPSDDIVARVWSWLMDPAHESFGLVAEADGELLAIGHYRQFARPSTGSVGIWLDDLFTVPAARGRGVARAILQRLSEMAQEQGCSVVRWITAEDNHQAQLLYSQVATRTRWVTYDAAPAK